MELESLVIVVTGHGESYAVNRADAHRIRKELVRRYRSDVRGYSGREYLADQIEDVVIE